MSSTSTQLAERWQFTNSHFNEKGDQARVVRIVSETGHLRPVWCGSISILLVAGYARGRHRVAGGTHCVHMWQIPSWQRIGTASGMGADHAPATAPS